MKRHREITLRLVAGNDMPVLFPLFSDPARSHLWGHRRLPDEAQFYEWWRYWSTERMAAKFIVQVSGKPAGIVFDYERSVEDGHTKATTLLLPQAAGRGAGVIA